MNIRINELILYRHFEDHVMERMAWAANTYNDKDADRQAVVDTIYDCINQLVTIARTHGFEGNLWHGYLTFVLTTNENAFSMSCEKTGAIQGSLNELALHDLDIFMEAYQMDWQAVEHALGIRFPWTDWKL